MNLSLFIESLTQNSPPSGISIYLESLWHFRKGDWEKSHDLIQHLPDSRAALIHAFLHRDEGDSWNADYWYRQANRNRPNMIIIEEWKMLVKELLDESYSN